MAHDWDTDDIEGALRPLVENTLRVVPRWMQRMKHFYVQHHPSGEVNTVTGARRTSPVTTTSRTSSSRSSSTRR